MAREPATCGRCHRPVADMDLTPMWKPGVSQPLRICNQDKCWDIAKARGYRLREQTNEDDAT